MQYEQPTKVGDGPALVESFYYDADGTRYRAYIVAATAEADPDRFNVNRVDFVLVEPAGVAGDFARRWVALALEDNDNALAQSYVAEKLGFPDPTHIDCFNVTVLLGVALDRAILVYDEQGYLVRVAPGEKATYAGGSR